MTNRAENYMGRESDHGGGFVVGLIAGAIVGAGLGMLFAPKTGAELRGQLSDSADEFAAIASRQYRRAASTANDLMERGRGAYDTAREAVSNGAAEAQRYARDTASDVAEDISNRAPTYSSEVRRS
jgi:gas vesicle protein